MSEGSTEIYCDGRCDEMGCRGHYILDFKDCAERAADPAELLAALFAEVERLRDAVLDERKRAADIVRHYPARIGLSKEDRDAEMADAILAGEAKP